MASTIDKELQPPPLQQPFLEVEEETGIARTWLQFFVDAQRIIKENIAAIAINTTAIAVNVIAIALNTTHRMSDGTDHSFINQSVTTTSSPLFVDLRLSGGVLTFKETTTPASLTDYGKLYTKVDNRVYFQDGAGVEHKLSYANLNIVAKTSVYTALIDDDVITCGAGNETFTVYLPIPTAGKAYRIKNVGTGVITVDSDTTGSTTIDKSNTVPLAQYESLTVVADAVEYWVV